ncbi:MAG: TonB-dependent receptor [Gammaproteobacteria bacterium]
MKSTNPCAYAVALVLAAAASQAVAQGADKGDVLEEVTITAQKRSENLQDVPLSVTAIGAEQLEARGIESLRGLNAIAPNVMFRSNPGAKLISTVGIRGSVTGQPAIWVDASVGLYLNGIYLGKSQGSVFDVVDIERVEVLRGPQGTLFGRNTEGGAINFITRAPSGEFGGKVSAEVGEYGRAVGRLTVDLPKMGIASATIGLRKEKQDGWAKNLSGPAMGAVDSDAARVAVNLDFSDDLQVGYSFDYSKQDNTPTPSTLFAVSGWGGTFPSVFGAGIGGAIQRGALPYVRTSRPDTVSTNGGPIWERSKTTAHSLTVDYALSENQSLKYIFADRKLYFGDSQDIDGMPLDSVATGFPAPFPQTWGMSAYYNRNTDYQQRSHELQWNGTMGDLKWVAGLYHFTDDGETNGAQLFTLFGQGPQRSNYAVDTTAKAVFAQADYTLADRWTLTAGIRTTKEDRGGWTHRYNTAGFGGARTTDILPFTSYDASFSGTTPMGSISLKVNEDLNVYVRVAKGFKSGGFSAELAIPAVATTPYQPQSSVSKELGIKATLLGGRARVNAAFFHNNITDLQITQLIPATTQSYLTNAGEAVYKGFEAEAQLLLAEGWRVQASYGYLSTEFKKYLDNSFRPGRPIIDTASNRLAAYAPRNTVNLNLDGRLLQTSFGTLRLIADYTFTSAMNLYTVNKSLSAPNAGGSYVVGLNSVPATRMLNARLVLSDIQTGGGTADVFIAARNLTDESRQLQGIDFSMFRNATWQEPRIFSLGVNYKF